MVSDFSIELRSISKRYGVQWIFRDLNYSFFLGNTYAIRGYNGSGKSTLLRILSTMESPTGGQRIYILNGKNINEKKVASLLSFAAPYVDIPGHLTVKEIINFHASFKSLNVPPAVLLSELMLERQGEKRIDQLSSGQKQKIKLALAIHSNDPLLILDEPGTNLDEINYTWFVNNIQHVKDRKLIFIATNESRDLPLCDREIVIPVYQKK